VLGAAGPPSWGPRLLNCFGHPSSMGALPWIRFLPASAVEEFTRELGETLEACPTIGNMDRIAEVLAGWKATAEIYADPALANDLRRPLAGTGTRVPRPAVANPSDRPPVPKEPG